MSEQVPPKRTRGCFFYGCISGLALLLIMLVAMLLGLHYARKMFNQFTDTKPLTLPVIQMSPADMKALHERLDAFGKALDEHRPVAPLTLSADEINAWIATSPNGQTLTGKVYVTIESNQLKGEISMPMEQIGLGIFKGRYLNGAVTFAVSFQEGILEVTAQHITVKGKPVPSVYMQQMRQTNLAQSMANDPEAKKSLERFEQIKIEDNKLVIVPKKAENPPPGEAEKTEPAVKSN